MDSEERVAMAEALLGRLLASVATADSKIGVIFATDTAMLGVLAALAPRFTLWTWREGVSAIVAGFLLLASILLLSLASFPRTTGPKGSLLFFASICRRSLAQYLDEMRELTVPEYLVDLVSQCHRNAEIAARKYFWIKWAMKAMYASVPFWLTTVFLLYRKRA